MAKRKQPVAALKKEPGPRNRAALEKGAAEWEQRPVRVGIEWERRPNGSVVAAAPHSDEMGHALLLSNTLGTASTDTMLTRVGELEFATRHRGDERGDTPVALNAALALVSAVAPDDELEGALAVQMASCHALSMDMLGRAKTTDRPDHLQLYGNLAVKLQRTFTAQVEALARLRGKGQQTVRVEHVTVHPGAQAIVGNVHHHSPGAPGSPSKSEVPPHESTPTARTGASKALPSPDAEGNGVPIPSDAERQMQAPRRTVTRRARQSKRPEARLLPAGDDRAAACAEGNAPRPEGHGDRLNEGDGK